VQVQTDELVGNSLGALAYCLEVLRQLRDPRLVCHDRTSSLTRRCGSSSSRLACRVDDLARADPLLANRAALRVRPS
jgi:hypothetical protein